MLADSSRQSAAPSDAYLKCSPEIIGGLIDTVSCALISHFPAPWGETYDVELVLDALRALRPNLSELSMFDALLHIVHGRWDDAVPVLREVASHATDPSYARALIAYCLSSKGDDGAAQALQEAKEGEPNPSARALIRAIEARNDLKQAVHGYRGGTFVLPQSCQTEDPFQAREDENAAPVAPASAQPFPQFGFLRA